jgi:hypothetical protein
MFLNSQKNLLFTAIQESGLNRRDFTLEESKELRVSYKPTIFYFRIAVESVVIDTSGGTALRLAVYYTPKQHGVIIDPDEEKEHKNIKEWSTAVGVFANWLSWIKRELSQPDLWAEMEHTPHMFEEEEPLTDERFTPAEVKQLKERIAEVEQRITSLGLPPDAEAAIIDVIREVPAKAKRFTKKELADTIVGALVKEGFKWGLTTEHLSGAWHACQHFFTLLIG